MLSNRVKSIVPSATMALNIRIDELKRSGVDIINFSLGEPDFNTPDNIINTCKAALDNGFTKYTPVAGIAQLRQAICYKLQLENGVNYINDEIVVSTGAKMALNNAMQVLVNPGDEVIIPTPCWVSYIEIVKLAGGVPVLVENHEDDKFQLNLEEIERAVTPKTKAILINSPNNPTGAVYTKERLEGLAKLAVNRGIYIISDEVYEKLVYGSIKHISIASLNDEIRELTIIVNGLSKACAMTGWRMGYTAAPKSISKGITSLQGHMTSNMTSFVQYASIEAILNCKSEIEKMRREFEHRKNYMYERLNNIPGTKCSEVDGAFYLLPNVSSYYGKCCNDSVILNSSDLCAYLLDKADVAVVPGSAFEAPDNIRISYSNSISNLKTGIDKIEQALNLLQ